MGTLGEKQDMPIYAKAKPAPLGYLLATFTLKPTQGKRESRTSWTRLHHAAGNVYTPCSWTQWSRYHAVMLRMREPRSLATFTPPTMHRLVDFPRATTATRRTSWQQCQINPHSHHWQQCHRPAIARAY